MSFADVSLGAGVIAVLYPEITILVLVLVMGANALITGVLQIVMAIRCFLSMRLPPSPGGCALEHTGFQPRRVRHHALVPNRIPNHFHARVGYAR